MTDTYLRDDTVVVAAATRPASRPQRPIINGRALHHETGYPLAGLTATAVLTTATGERRTVGTASTDAAGHFSVLPSAGANVWKLVGQRGVTLTLQIGEPGGQPWLQSGDLSGSIGGTVTLSVPVPDVQPTADQWKQFATRLADRRHTRLHEAVRHLVLAQAKESVVGDWPLTTRHAMARQLERSYLDPAGILARRQAPPTFYGVWTRQQWESYRLRVETPGDAAITAALDRAAGLYTSYPGIHHADWELDLTALGAGNPSRAVTQFERLYDVSTSDVTSAPAPFAKSPLAPYRDYLRTLFTGSSDSDAESQAKLTQLRTRFHQNFKTADGLRRPANAILAGILKEILTAPTGSQYGFGVAPATIQPQGTRTHREYLDYLIALSGTAADELAKRYRIDLDRPDTTMSTAVEENIATLQGFYRDGFQSKKDPVPIIPDGLLGKAPFFLYYDEWLRRTGPFYPENFYRLTDTYTCGAEPGDRLMALAEAAGAAEPWFEKMIKIEDLVAEGHAKVRYGLHRIAINDYYLQAWRLGIQALVESVDIHIASTGSGTVASVFLTEMPAMVGQLGHELRGHTLASEADLAEFGRWVRWAGCYVPDDDPIQPVQMFTWWLDHNIAYRWLALIRLCAFTIPACIGDACVATGDYAAAVHFFGLGTRRPVGRGPVDVVPPYRNKGAYYAEYHGQFSGDYTSGTQYRRGSLPYALDTSSTPMKDYIPYAYSAFPESEDGEQQQGSYLAEKYHNVVLHQMEKRWFRMRQADALIQWADSLYRTDEPGAIQRAREMYKAALQTLGATTGISPQWGAVVMEFGYGAENPALTVLKGQSRKGITQIDFGLNYYGADDSLVPHLRYRTLKDAADRYAAAAKSAETDLLAYLGKIEDALVEQMVHANMLTKAQLQASIAGEQQDMAEFEVGLAQRQVTAVQAEINRKKDELEDESGFFDQFVDVISGMKDIITGLPAGLTGFAASGGKAVATGTSAGMTGSAALAAGSGALAGYAIFLYAGITSLGNVTDNLTSLKQQIKALQNDALPLAQAQVRMRQRQVTVAQLQQRIAEADAQLARDLIHFAQLRFLNVDFWSELARVTRRTLRRYLSLGGRFAWLAERALAYEQDRPLDIVRLDYTPVKFQGITGAGQMLADLVELDSTRLDGLRQSLPVRRTWSMAFHFPLQFAQLKATGRCEFHTGDLELRQAHPGTYGHRIETVRVAVQNLQGVTPYRGLLRQTGLSTVTRADGAAHLLLRFEDALPLTEPGPDGTVSTPPFGETLGVFEGSGVDTSWVLELPPAANPYGLADLADVLFTVEGRAHFSPVLYDKQKDDPPTDIQSFIAVSAAAHWPEMIEALRDPEVNAVTIGFDLATVDLAASANRTITNAFLFVAGGGDATGPVQVKLATPATTVNVTLADGVAVSNAGPLAGGQPVQPLNALVGKPASQVVTVVITKAQLGGIDFAKARDVVLGIEFQATLTG